MTFRVIKNLDNEVLGVIETNDYTRLFERYNIKFNYQWMSKIVTRAEYETYLAFGIEDLKEV